MARELVGAGYDVTIAARDPAKAAAFDGAAVVQADLFDIESLRKAFRGMDAVYLNLSVRPGERPADPHAETHGLRRVIEAAREMRVKRLAMISSLVMNYQGRDGFDWWVFDVKHQAVRLIKESAIPSTVFYPSSFFENFLDHEEGKITLPGKSKHPMWFVAGSDYGKQVARSFAIDGNEHRDYPVQGPEPFTYDEAARIFVANFEKADLKVSHVPMALLKAMGLFSRRYRHLANIVEALNEYPEQFMSQRTWEELGKPETTLAEWARSLSA